MTSSVSKRDRDAYRQRCIGVSLDKIRENLGFKSNRETRAAIERGMREAFELTRDRDNGIDETQLDELAGRLFLRAANDPENRQAVSDFVRVVQARQGLPRPGADNGERLADCLETTVAAAPGLDADGVDAALVSAGRKLALQIDRALERGNPQESTKAMYLVPHLVNVLREMSATPAARAANIREGSEPGSQSKLAQLREGYVKPGELRVVGE